MSAVPITIVGIQTSSDGTSGQVTIVGMASITGLGVGGGPIIPDPKPPSPGTPTHPIVLPGDPSWGDPHPEHPIVYPPGKPPIDSDLHPEHPIVLPPDPPIDPPTEPPTNPPDPQWVWGYSISLKQWLRVYVPGEGQAGPK